MHRRQTVRWASAVAVAVGWAIPALAQAPAGTAPSAPAASSPPPATTSAGVGFGASTETGASATAPAEAPPPVVAPQPQPPPPPPPPPPPAPAVADSTAPDADAERTDHQKVVGAWGAGLLSSMDVLTLSPGPNYTEQPVRVVTLGVRHWLSEGLGFEVGFGFNTVSGTREDTIVGRKDVPDPTIWGLG
jgi:hypothetical protein